MSQRFKIQGRVYDVGDLEELTIRDTLLIEIQTEQLGRRMSYGDVIAMAQRVNALPEKDRATSGDAYWVFAFTVWASKRLAGEDITFDDAISIRMSEVEVLPELQDHKPKDPQKPRARKGSGAAGQRAAAKAAQRTPAASSS